MSEIQESILEIKSGNFSSYKYITDLFEETLFKIGLSYDLSFSEAEDVMNETFYSLSKKLMTFEYQNDNAFKKWLCTVHVNNILGYLRKQKIKFDNVDDIKWEMIPVSEENNIEDQRTRIIKDEIEQLPETDKILLNMRAKEIPYKEIAKLINGNPNNLKVRFLRLKQYLEKKLLEKFQEFGLY